MRIVIDCRFAALHAGLGRYTRELVSAMLPLRGSDDVTLLVRSKDEWWLNDLPVIPPLLVADVGHYSFREQAALPVILRSGDFDLLYSPHFNVPFFCPIPFVTTIHDLILHRFPNNASPLKKAAYRLLMRHAVLKSKAIITVSDFVAGELKKTYGERLSAKLHTTYEGVHPRFMRRSPEEVAAFTARHALPSSFFLYVGNSKQHKNVQMLIDSFEAAAVPGMSLVLVTSGPEASKLRHVKGMRLLSHLSDEELPLLYNAATCFVTASLYEGFCLPAVEALACGCPVIAVDRGPLREVTKGHALLTEPTLEKVMIALQNAPTDRTPRRLWEWESVARGTWEVLRAG